MVRDRQHARGLDTIATTAFVSTYPPQKCGIAAFTAELAASVGDREIVALQPSAKVGFYPAEVSHRIARDVPADYVSAANWIDSRSFGVVSIQHDYSIWGGPDGSNVLDFVKSLKTPVVSTLHTVLQRPSKSQRSILTKLVRASAATVVMSASASELLTSTYGADPARVEIVPHGVPDLPFVAPDSVKTQMGLAGRTVILSFGLVGPDKGYDSAIAAMPAVLRADPKAVYVILGVTDPELMLQDGETHREQLMDLAWSLDVASQVRFVGRFVTAAELGLWLGAADIFVTPYPGLEQAVSGSLAYAMGAGKAIVSTPYAYAVEQLADGRGRLVAAGSTESLAEGLVELAKSSEKRTEYGRKAHAYTRGMLWPVVGAAYREIFARYGRPITLAEQPVPAKTPKKVATARA
ncbi:MAG: glycosyltransferase family 4 protein [Chloroflexota bacterium]